MNTTVETKMNDPNQVNSKPANDESIVVDMDDKQSKKKISKIIERKKKIKIEKESVFYEASLILKDVKPNQSGNYTCGPSNSLSASVRLHITQGKYNFYCEILGICLIYILVIIFNLICLF